MSESATIETAPGKPKPSRADVLTRQGGYPAKGIHTVKSSENPNIRLEPSVEDLAMHGRPIEQTPLAPLWRKAVMYLANYCCGVLYQSIARAEVTVSVTACPTAAIDILSKRMYINPTFVKEWCKYPSDLAGLVLHECMHPIIDPTDAYREERLKSEKAADELNICLDALINCTISRLNVSLTSLMRRFYRTDTFPDALLRPGAAKAWIAACRTDEAREDEAIDNVEVRLGKRHLDIYRHLYPVPRKMQDAVRPSVDQLRRAFFKKDPAQGAPDPNASDGEGDPDEQSEGQEGDGQDQGQGAPDQKNGKGKGKGSQPKDGDPAPGQGGQEQQEGGGQTQGQGGDGKGQDQEGDGAGGAGEQELEDMRPAPTLTGLKADGMMSHDDLQNLDQDTLEEIEALQREWDEQFAPAPSENQAEADEEALEKDAEGDWNADAADEGDIAQGAPGGTAAGKGGTLKEHWQQVKEKEDIFKGKLDLNKDQRMKVAKTLIEGVYSQLSKTAFRPNEKDAINQNCAAVDKYLVGGEAVSAYEAASERDQRGEIVKAMAPAPKPTRSIIPYNVSRSGIALLACDEIPTWWRKPKSFDEEQARTALVYVDVSGSMWSYIPYAFRLIIEMQRFSKAVIYHFSTMLVKTTIEEMKKSHGRFNSTGGTSFNDVLQHFATNPEVEHNKKALMITDGYDSVGERYKKQLKEKGKEIYVLLYSNSPNPEELIGQCQTWCTKAWVYNPYEKGGK